MVSGSVAALLAVENAVINAGAIALKCRPGRTRPTQAQDQRQDHQHVNRQRRDYRHEEHRDDPGELDQPVVAGQRGVAVRERAGQQGHHPQRRETQDQLGDHQRHLVHALPEVVHHLPPRARQTRVEIADQHRDRDQAQQPALRRGGDDVRRDHLQEDVEKVPPLGPARPLLQAAGLLRERLGRLQAQHRLARLHHARLDQVYQRQPDEDRNGAGDEIVGHGAAEQPPEAGVLPDAPHRHHQRRGHQRHDDELQPVEEQLPRQGVQDVVPATDEDISRGRRLRGGLQGQPPAEQAQAQPHHQPQQDLPVEPPPPRRPEAAANSSDRFGLVRHRLPLPAGRSYHQWQWA